MGRNCECDGQITMSEYLQNSAGMVCPWDESKHCSNADDCKEFKELYG